MSAAPGPADAPRSRVETSTRHARDRESLGAPGLKAADDVRGVEAEPARCCGGEAGLKPLVADEDETEIAARDFGIAVGAARIQAPLEHVARVVPGAGDVPVARALQL